MQRKLKKITGDVLINLFGTGISLAILQLVIYPLIARIIDAEAYGQMQSIISVVYMVSGTMGMSLCTTRLVREYEYQEKKETGDYNRLCLFCILIIIIVLPLALLVYGKGYDLIDLVLVLAVSVLNFTTNYYAVGFRLKIDYKAIFISKIIGAFGYVAGFACFYFTHKWQFVYLAAFLLETIYYTKHTKLLREPLAFTPIIRETVRTFFNLGAANLLSRSLTYIDKLFLYPVLGGTAVSIYYTANIFGKLISMTIEPITNVILSYLSRESGVPHKVWKRIIPAAIAMCVVLYVICILISSPVIRFFYPQWADEAIKLVPLTTFCLSVSAFISIMYPFSLKLIESSKQIVINAVGLGTYVATSFVLANKYAIFGFCLALLISYLSKMICMLYYCIRIYRTEENVTA